MKYYKQEDGEWIYPKRHGYKMMCCDCGLVHKINIDYKKWGNGIRIAFSAVRDKRATNAARRSKILIKKIQQLTGKSVKYGALA